MFKSGERSTFLPVKDISSVSSTDISFIDVSVNSSDTCTSADLWYRYRFNDSDDWNQTYEFYDDVQDANIKIASGVFGTWHYQTFTIGSVGANIDFICTGVRFRLKRSAGVPGLFEAYLYKTSGGKRTGAVLATATMNPASISTTGFNWHYMNFTSRGVHLSPDTMYAIGIFNAGGGFNKWVCVGYNTTSSYGGGSRWKETFMGSTEFPNKDFLFYVRGDWMRSGCNSSVYPFVIDFGFTGNYTDEVCHLGFYEFFSQGFITVGDSIASESVPKGTEASTRFLGHISNYNTYGFSLVLVLFVIGGFCFVKSKFKKG